MKLRCKDGKICLAVKMEIPTALLKKKVGVINERTTVSPTIIVCMNLQPYSIKIWAVFNCSIYRMSFSKAIIRCVENK